MNIAHTMQDVRESRRRVNANVLNGVDAEYLDPQQVKEVCPIINIEDDIRYPVMGATYQPRAGIAKHDHVAWAFARKCDEMGVDIIQNCEVTGSRWRPRHSLGARRPRRLPPPDPVAPLQALVSELFEPVHPTVVMSNHVHVYVSQAHKGELVMGAGIDPYVGYGQRGGFHVIEEQMAAAVELFPIFSRAHLLRTWGGIVDTTFDASPIVSKTPIDQLYVNCGWGTGGFKGTPGAGLTFAHTIAHDEPHPLNAPFALDRFETGHLIDEHGAAAVAH
ncbi:Sarcosine oxidase subunit beta [Eumeta japonica]|uniref:FAD-dependent oxidoreductase domain-containing protein 1 n=1 Tax=Eumeta variegata TaxID=151549 RepID=A0A4C1T386_EUMVA|nr:Sarcosine oxidase subunit beta [Eumeta japonica]